ncbi:hypothetical protein KXS11_05620 [Plantibacter flavus]
MSNFGAVEGIRDEGAAAMLQGLPKDAVDEDSLVEDDPDVVADEDTGD